MDQLFSFMLRVKKVQLTFFCLIFIYANNLVQDTKSIRKPVLKMWFLNMFMNLLYGKLSNLYGGINGATCILFWNFNHLTKFD